MSKPMGRPPLPKQKLYDLMYQEEYFNRHIYQDPDSECILWDGPTHRQGYGFVGAWRMDGTKIMTTTHRIAARQKFQRALDSDEWVIHTCSNPLCVNHDHLAIGDRSDIHAIMKKNGRYKNAGRKKGSKNRAK